LQLGVPVPAYGVGLKRSIESWQHRFPAWAFTDILTLAQDVLGNERNDTFNEDGVQERIALIRCFFVSQSTTFETALFKTA